MSIDHMYLSTIHVYPSYMLIDDESQQDMAITMAMTMAMRHSLSSIKAQTYLTPGTVTVKLPVGPDVFSPVVCSEQMVIKMVVRRHYLSALANVDQGRTDVGKV